jgi:hypothetical protein
MVAEVPTVEIYAGDTAIWPVYTFKDDDGNPRNLVQEGWGSWEAQWRPKADSDMLINLVIDDSQANVGIIKVVAGSTKTVQMGGNGVWDLQAVNGSTVKTWVRGKTKWIQDVTRG